MDKVREFVPYMFKFFGEKAFSLFNAENSYIDNELPSKLTTKESKENFAAAVARLRNEPNEVEKVVVDNGEVIEITLR